MEYAIDTAIECHKLGVNTVAVTAGYIENEPRKEFFKYMDAANVDLKGFTNKFYKKLCGVELNPVLDTLKYIKQEAGTWLEITTLLIPDENDSDEDLEKQCSWIVENLGSDVPLHFSAFHPDWKMLDKDFTPLETLLKAYKIAKNAGINHVYTGNIPHFSTETTYCASCNAPLVVRSSYTIKESNLDGSLCSFCKSECAGRF